MIRYFNYPSDGDIKLSNHFKVKEFRSRAFPFILVADELIQVLENLRCYLNVPINVNSGYRSETHNNSVKGSSNSAHLVGCAADISSPKVTPREIACALQKLYGKKIAIGLHEKENYVHVDIIYTGNWYVDSLKNKVGGF